MTKLAFLLSVFFLHLFTYGCAASEIKLPNGSAVSADTISYSGSLRLCSGGIIKLELENVNVASKIEWLLNGGTITGETTSILTVGLPGNYSAMVTLNGKSTTFKTLSIGSSIKPTADFTNTADGKCATSPIHFTNSSTGTNLKYSWNFGDPNSGKNDTSSVKDPTHLFIGNHGDGVQTYNVTLMVTNIDGCTSDIFSVKLNLNQTPSTKLDGTGATFFNGAPYFVNCGNSPFTFNFSNKSSTTNTRYNIQWGDGSGNFNARTFTTVSHLYNPGNYTMYYSVTGNNGCTNTQTYHVFVGTAPAKPKFTPLTNQICVTSPLILNLSDIKNNSAGTTYKINYSDSSVEIYKGLTDTVMHYFKQNSFGRTAQTSLGSLPNAYIANIVASNPCGTAQTDCGPVYVSDPQPSAFSTSPSGTIDTNTQLSLLYPTAIGYTVINGTTIFKNKFVWKITPLGGIAPNGDLGSDNNSNDVAQWVTGTANPSVKFIKGGNYTITLKTGNASCGINYSKVGICVENTPTASFKHVADQLCAGTTVSLINTSPAGICGINAYKWIITYSNNLCTSADYKFVNGTTDESENPQIQFNAAGNYSIRLENGGPNKAMPFAYSQSIQVLAQPIIKIKTPDSLCISESFQTQLQVLNCNTANIDAYQWSFKGSNTASSTLVTPPEVFYSTPGVYTVKLFVVTSCGISTDSVKVTVRPNPVVSLQQPQFYCAGSVTPIDNFIGNTQGITFKWTNDNPTIGLPSAGTGPLPSFTATNTNQSMAAVANIAVIPYLGNCNGGIMRYAVTVYPALAKPKVLSPVNLCVNDAAPALTATQVAGNNLNWYADSLLTTKLGAAPTPLTNQPGTLKFYVTQVSISGCESKAAGITVYINPAIVNNQIGADQSLCFGDVAKPLNSTGKLSGGSNKFKFQWQYAKNGSQTWENVPNNVSENLLPPITTGTIFYRRLVTSGSCTSVSNEISVTFQAIIENYNIITADQVLNRGDNPSPLIGEIPAGGNGTFGFEWQSSEDSYAWNIISNARQANYQPNATDIPLYYRRVTMSGNCIVISQSVKVTVKSTISVPNTFTPNGDGINDKWAFKGFEYGPDVWLRVYTRYGAMILDDKKYLNSWDGTYLNKRLPAGVYYYILIAGQTKLSGPVTLIF